MRRRSLKRAGLLSLSSLRRPRRLDELGQEGARAVSEERSEEEREKNGGEAPLNRDGERGWIENKRRPAKRRELNEKEYKEKPKDKPRGARAEEGGKVDREVQGETEGEGAERASILTRGKRDADR